jgi:hypothetical protein
MDTTERGVRGGKQAQRQGEDRVNLWIFEIKIKIVVTLMVVGENFR